MEYLAQLGRVTPTVDAAATEINSALTLAGPAQTGALLSLLEPRWSRDEQLLSSAHAQRLALRAENNHSTRSTA